MGTGTRCLPCGADLPARAAHAPQAWGSSVLVLKRRLLRPLGEHDARPRPEGRAQSSVPPRTNQISAPRGRSPAALCHKSFQSACFGPALESVPAGASASGCEGRCWCRSWGGWEVRVTPVCPGPGAAVAPLAGLTGGSPGPAALVVFVSCLRGERDGNANTISILEG